MRTSDRFALLLLLSVITLSSTPALASHYPVESADFLSDQEKTAFKAQGIDGTDRLQVLTAGPKEIEELALKTGLDKGRLREIGEFCDLLQIRGIGPKMAGLLRLSGVFNRAALARENAAGLAGKLKAANLIHRVSEVLPQAEILEDWINQAAGRSNP